MNRELKKRTSFTMRNLFPPKVMLCRNVRTRADVTPAKSTWAKNFFGFQSGDGWLIGVTK